MTAPPATPEHGPWSGSQSVTQNERETTRAAQDQKHADHLDAKSTHQLRLASLASAGDESYVVSRQRDYFDVNQKHEVVGDPACPLHHLRTLARNHSGNEDELCQRAITNPRTRGRRSPRWLGSR